MFCPTAVHHLNNVSDNNRSTLLASCTRKNIFKPRSCVKRSLGMDDIEITPDPPLPACLAIPFDIESALPGRSLTVAELLQYKFPNPFATPHNGTGVPVWSTSPPHDVDAMLLLSCTVPPWETVKHLLLDIQWLTPTPQSLSRAAVSPGDALPNCLPIWVLSFWDRLSEAYEAYLSWRRCSDWVNAPHVGPLANQHLIGELDVLLRARVCWHGYLTGKR